MDITVILVILAYSLNLPLIPAVLIGTLLQFCFYVHRDMTKKSKEQKKIQSMDKESEAYLSRYAPKN